MVGDRAFWLAGLSLITVVLPLPSAAQGIGGGITGRVRDQSSGAVPAVLVQLVNASTGQTWSVSSDSEGMFEAREVPPGSYTLSMSGSRALNTTPIAPRPSSRRISYFPIFFMPSSVLSW
jgi:Carboxypeptidase regulatory-like domain